MDRLILDGDSKQKVQNLIDGFAMDQANGYSVEYSLKSRENQLLELLTAPSFLTILLTILPKALPLVLTIFQEMRSGKKFLEVLLAHLPEIIELVVAILPVFTPQVSNDVVTPTIPK